MMSVLHLRKTKEGLGLTWGVNDEAGAYVTCTMIPPDLFYFLSVRYHTDLPFRFENFGLDLTAFHI